jgi:hypothetical protein
MKVNLKKKYQSILVLFFLSVPCFSLQAQEYMGTFDIYAEIGSWMDFRFEDHSIDFGILGGSLAQSSVSSPMEAVFHFVSNSAAQLFMSLHNLTNDKEPEAFIRTTYQLRIENLEGDIIFTSDNINFDTEGNLASTEFHYDTPGTVLKGFIKANLEFTGREIAGQYSANNQVVFLNY